MRITGSAIAAGAWLLLSGLPVAADPLADFYRGRTLTCVVSAGPGGAYDGYARLLARHIGNFIPGHPTVVVENMPGSGGRKAANWLYNIAPKDGSTLGGVLQSVAVDQVLSPQGIHFDARKFDWIGTPVVNNNVFVTWRTSGVATIDQARRKQINVGSTGAESTNGMYPAIANAVLGTKFKIIEGYKGSEDIDLAMERGELDGRPAISWQSVKIEHKDWIEGHKINILFQMGPKKDPELPDIPLMTDLAQNQEQLQILQFISSTIGMGRPMATTPGVPADRIAALRHAFDEMIRDPAFLQDAARQGLAIAPESGKELQEQVDRTVGISPLVLAKIKSALSR